MNLEKAPERHGVLYIDREFLINNPDKNVSIDYIVNFDNVKTFKKCLTEFVGENGIYIPQNEFEVSKETIDDMLQNFNDRQDRFERWLNTYDGVFNMTDEEAALSGKKSKEEYYQSALYRSMGEANIYAKIKKQNEALHLEYLAYQLDRKEAHKAKKAEILQNLQAGDNIINAAVFGHIAMCDEKIVAIWFNNTPVSFFEMKLDDYIDVDSLSNGATPLLFYREIMEKIPNSIAFINFAAEAFSKYLPLHNVLEDKPSGCSDLEWRAWSEARIKAQNR